MKRDILKTETTFSAMELEFKYKSIPHIGPLPKVDCSQVAYNYLRPIFDPFVESYECFYAVYLNRANKIVGHAKIAQGTATACAVDPCFIILHALKLNARGIIIAHNHPSGGLIPSQQDIKLTKQVKEAAKLYGIDLFDHLIMTYNTYYSFADESML